MMDNVITTELDTTRQQLTGILALFSAADFNVVPFEGSWTAGQVTEHIYKSIKAAPGLLTGASKPTDRDPSQQVPQLRAMFLDFTSKMKSPEFILPSDAPKDYPELRDAVTNVFTDVVDASKKIDTNLTVADFEFPGSGPLTRLELLNFLSVHTQRHIHQLQKIRRVL